MERINQHLTQYSKQKGHCLGQLFALITLASFVLVNPQINAFDEKTQGVEFVERQISFSKDTFKTFTENFKESHFDKKTGFNELRFHFNSKEQSTRNFSPSKNFNYVLKQKEGQTYEIHWDKEGDGFFEFIKKKVVDREFVFEELYSVRGLGFHDVRRRYYPKADGQTFTVLIATREKQDGLFVDAGERTASALQFGGMMEKRQCLENRTFLLDYALVDSVNEIVEEYNLNWPGLSFMEISITAEFDKTCDDKARKFSGSKKSFDEIYKEAIDEGLSCLQNLAQRSGDRNSFSRILYLNSAASLAGQQVFVSPNSRNSMEGGVGGFPRRQSRSGFENQKVLCSQNGPFNYQANGHDENALGMASTRVGQTTNLSCHGGELTLTHPYISLNFDQLQRIAPTIPQRSRERRLKQLIFHEFLHTTGEEHKTSYDPVQACAVHCFGGAPNDQADEAARRICEGEGMGGFNVESVSARVQAQVEYNHSVNLMPPNFEANLFREIAPEFSGGVAQGILNSAGIRR